MKAPQTPANPSHAEKAFQNSPGAARATRHTARAALLILFIAVVSVFAALPGSTASRPGSSAIPPAAPAKKAPEGAGIKSSLPLTPSAFIFQAAPPPIATYAADCTTAKNSFNLSEVVCVKVVGAPASGAVLILSDPDNFQRGAALSIVANAQSFSFTLPSSSTTAGVDNRGTWAVAVVNTVDNSRRAVATFLVHDPQQQVADVTISKTVLNDTSVTAGSNASFRIYVTNQGPDNASNVSFTDHTPSNATFVSFTQDGVAPIDPNAFSCATTAGTTTCSKASMAVGETASFTAVYLISSTIGNNTGLSDTVDIASATTDSHTSSNSSSVDATASNPNPPACTISCPANVTQDNDPGQAGAVVTYPDPTTGGSCGAVTTDHPSGSFFPIGTTTVNVSISGGPSCTFTVTVNDTRTARITLNGPADQTVECTTGFTDLGANAADKDGNPLQVTTAVTVPDPSGAVDSNGDAVQVPAPGNVVNPNVPNNYTITYSATSPPPDNTVVTVTRVVHVVDTTAPVITLSNTAGYTPQSEVVTVTNDDGTTSQVTETVLVGTIECHGSIGVPTAAAFDGCANASVPVTTTGGINPDVPGTYEITFKASDAAGNDSEQRVRVTVVDTQKPVITLNGSSSMSILRTSTFTDPGATASDACAGPVPVTVTGSVDTNTAGVYTLTYNAVDPSGNAADPVTRTVTVYIYTFTGFFSPINNTAINQVNAGRSVPVKFSLNGNQGLDIFAAGSPFTQQVTCGQTNVTDLQETGTAGNSSLTYDASSGQYIYTWKTESSWAGTCRILTVKLNDGMSYTATFKFK